MARRGAVILCTLALAQCGEARQLSQPSCVSAHLTQRDVRVVHRLRGGADKASTGGCMPWLSSLLRMLFPGNPPRARSDVLPPPPAADKPAPTASSKAAITKGSRAKRGARGGKAGVVHAVHSKAEFDSALKSARSSQLVVVDFFATWCGPCKQIAPKFEEMAAAMPHVKFVKVDVDQCKEVSQAYKVSSMPTFKMLKGGKEVGTMSGADENALREKVEGLAGKPDRWAAAGSGRTL